MATIKIITVRDGKMKREEIDDTGHDGMRLKAMQAIVGGLIQAIQIGPVDLWLNEEGLLLDLPLRQTPWWPDPIAGDFFFARHDGEGNTASLTEADMRAIELAWDRAAVDRGEGES